jgi:hypothetical protein
MPRISTEQRREALRKRTKRGVNERGQKGLGRKSALDYSKAGNRKIIKYEIKSGKEINYIDILPFEITQDWYKDLRSVSGTAIGLDIGFTDYKLEIPVHRNVGEDNDVFLCLRLAFGKKCPLCEEMYSEWDKDEDDQDTRKIQALKPSWRCFYNVCDYDNNETPIQLWEDFSYFLFEEALQEAMETEDEGIVTFSDLEMGSSIEFKGREKKLGKNKFIETHSISFKPRDAYDESILKETFPLDAMLVIPTYEQVAKAHLGLEDGNSVATESEVQQKTRTRKRFEEDKTEQKETEKPPWDECPHGGEFGIDCNAIDECGECDEDLFQACAVKQDEIRKEAEQKTKVEDKSPVATSTRSRRGKSSANTEKDNSPRKRSRRK